ncbi:MAG TPA: ClpX C4-type zinc finger protein [Polyangiaceae bacterium]|nr:ClpX C4-type zinc finger protein [Polyangiaceae bacterium]
MLRRVEASKTCSFCGQSEGGNVQIFAAESSPSAAICDECVLTCAKAVDVERRLSERPSSPPRDDSAPDSERPQPATSWAAFRVGPLDLEWLAEPAVVVRVRRRDEPARAVVEYFPTDTDPTVDDAETVAEDHWTTLHD